MLIANNLRYCNGRLCISLSPRATARCTTSARSADGDQEPPPPKQLQRLKFPVQTNLLGKAMPCAQARPWLCPGEGQERSGAGIFQHKGCGALNCLDAVLCSLLWVTLLGQGVGLGDPQRSLPTLTILCDSVTL